MDVSIVVPVYDERDNLRPLFAEIKAAMAATAYAYEIIAVDDGSRDGSTAVLEELAAQDPNARVIVLRSNCGQAAAFDAGFRHAKGRYIVTLDADLQNDPRDIPKMLEPLGQGFDLVSGWRKDRKDDFLMRTIPSRIANALIRAVTRTRVHDLGCSLKAYRREIVQELRLYGEMHRFITVLVESLGAKVTEQVVHHRPRAAGESKYGLGRVFKVLLDLLTVWFMRSYHTKPIYLFGGTGFAMLAGSVATSAYVLYEKFEHEIFVHRNPLFIISMILAVVGVQLIGMGLIAEIMIRIYFESQHKPSYSIVRTLNLHDTYPRDASHSHA